MQHELDLTMVIQYLKDGQNSEAFKLLEHLHPTEIAEVLSSLSVEMIQSALFLFPNNEEEPFFVNSAMQIKPILPSYSKPLTWFPYYEAYPLMTRLTY